MPALISRGSSAAGFGPTTWSVLRHRRFRWYFAGNSLSNIGTWVQNAAQVVLAYQLTGSTTGVGLVVGAQFVSPLLLGPVAGAVADRFDRRHVLLVTQLGSATVCVVLAGLQSAGQLGLATLVTCAFLIGVGYTFTLPAQSAFVPTLVPVEETRAAVTLNGVSSNIGRALAPILGLGVVAVLGFGAAFAVNAASFLALAAILLRMRSGRPQFRSRSTALLDGFRIVRRTRRLQVLLLIVAASTVATDPPLVLGPSLAVTFGMSAAMSAYFLCAFGIGTVIGSLLPGLRTGLTGTGWFLAVLGGATISLSIVDSFGAALVAVATSGIASLLVGTATQSLMLEIAGPAQAGRVMAMWAMAYVGSRPIATAVDTWLAGVLDARTSAALLAVPALTVAGVILSLKATNRGRRWGAKVLRGTLAVSPRALPS
ncbi:MFS transporter [Actinoplanes sp. NPDC048967]|uniref:MFS transporter n=1 Tax=Actinoplanes sp. NPDC048967 TaxID=3155269 RepID=UPI0033D67065